MTDRDGAVSTVPAAAATVNGPDPPLTPLDIDSVARYVIGMSMCGQCGATLPRPLPGAGRRMTFCSPACRQKAYRARGGHASGTTGAQRRRNEQRNTAHHDPHTPPE